MPPGLPIAGSYGGSLRLSDEELDRGRGSQHLRRDGKGFLSDPAGQERAPQCCYPRFIHHLLFMPRPDLKPLDEIGLVFSRAWRSSSIEASVFGWLPTTYGLAFRRYWD
jgi:hypothetical protein